MNSDQLKGKWKQMKGMVKERWGKLTDDDLTVIDGQHDELVGKIQERYGIARDVAEKQVEEWASRYSRESGRVQPHGEETEQEADTAELDKRKAS